MKIDLKYIQAFVFLVLIAFLYGFSDRRNARRSQGNVSIEYTNGQTVFITKSTVNKLLITKSVRGKNQSKDSLDLNTMEAKLTHNPMIANAEVFQTVTGELGVQVTQRTPLARVLGKKPYYIDKKGDRMPLSSNYSARVPLISGVDTTQITEVFPLVQKIENDEFLKKHITAIERNPTGDYILRLRKSNMTVNFGPVSEIEHKLRNFKVFYKKAWTTQKLDSYSKVNLKFTNQVVCTKKKV